MRVRYVSTQGGQGIVHVSVPSVDYLHGFLMDKFTARREVVGFRTSVIPHHVAIAAARLHQRRIGGSVESGETCIHYRKPRRSGDV